MCIYIYENDTVSSFLDNCKTMTNFSEMFPFVKMNFPPRSLSLPFFFAPPKGRLLFGTETPSKCEKQRYHLNGKRKRLMIFFSLSPVR